MLLLADLRATIVLPLFQVSRNSSSNPSARESMQNHIGLRSVKRFLKSIGKNKIVGKDWGFFF